ncbi:MAG TPA: UDP-3-O-(3-hydroxymyristoyl)glucosamine N-acyltransferase [Thermoanaerobaculia bacterium]|nr:UDP-3-O-(3-hydroxymyristoyl)glucosamine N-acyltransferase [Thermoanaerobaculia bacterium]
MSSYRLGELAAEVGGEVRGNPERLVVGLRPLELAGPEDLSFLTNPKYRALAEASRAGALLVDAAGADGLDRDLIVCADPYLAVALLLQKLHPRPVREGGVHRTAVVGRDCEISESARVGPYVVLGDRVRIGAAAVLEAHVVVGEGCSIGAGVVLHPHVVVYDRAEIGEGCVLHAGAVVGSDGFGFAAHGGKQVKVPQLGTVRLGREVEVGANSAIDRATFEATTIGDHTKIDNLVQVGHNVQIGSGCILCGQVGISGSTRLGDGVVFAGQAGAANHLDIGDGVRVAAQTAVFASVEAGQAVGGTPAVPLAEWRRQVAALRRLPELLRRLARLERRLDATKEPGEG